MTFGHLELFSRDPLRSLAFYRDVLGFAVTAVQGEAFVWLKQGELEVLLRPGEPPPPAARYEDGPVGIVLYADDLDARVAELKARGLEIRGTVDSDRCFTFTDPDGNWFQLVDPGDHGA